MTKTVAELRLLITDLEKSYTNKLYKLQSGATVTKIKELDGTEETMSTPFNFSEELILIDIDCSKLARYKGILSKANNQTSIDEVDTIQTAIVKLQEKRKLLDKAEWILSNTKESKQRKADGGLSSANAYYQVISLNFDESELSAYKDSLRSELNTLEVKIQNANNNTKVEI